jgi:hypothetical protein
MEEEYENPMIGPEYLADLATVREGVSEAALAVLERRFGFHSSLFTVDATYSDLPNEVFQRQAFIREGQRNVICFIRTSLNKK